MTTLDEIKKIEQQITRAKFKVIQALQLAAYGEQGQPRALRKHLRKFSGFRFEENSHEYEEKMNEVKQKFKFG